MGSKVVPCNDTETAITQKQCNHTETEAYAITQKNKLQNSKLQRCCKLETTSARNRTVVAEVGTLN